MRMSHGSRTGARRCLVAFAALLILCITASAATITSTCSTLSGPTDLSGALDCPTFDSVLGTLSSITIDFSGGISATITVNNMATAPETVTASESANFDLGALTGFPSGLLFVASVTTGPQMVMAGQTLTFSEASGTQTGNVSDSNTATFTSYIGDGVTTYSVPISTLTSQSVSGGGGNVGVAFNTAGTAGASVTYDFTESTVPEPLTGLLIGTGLLCLGLVSTRKSRRDEQEE
jgi:hypothetical protein